MSSELILVTGAAGYIGRALIARMEQLKLSFRATDKSECSPVPPSRHKIEVLDVTKREHWERSLEGIHTVIHLAAESHVGACERHPNEAMLTNLASIHLLLEAAKNRSVRKIIFPSSFTVYGPSPDRIHERLPPQPYNLYAHMKLWCEQLLLQAQQTHGIEPIILRQSNVCGKGPVTKSTVVQMMAERWNKHLPMVIHGTGRQMRNFIDIRDCVDCYVHILNMPVGGIFNLGGPSTLNIEQIAKLVNEIGYTKYGKQVPITHQALTKPGQEREPEKLECDFSKLNHILGFYSNYAIADTLASLMEAEQGD